MKLFFDTETTGLEADAVLLQAAAVVTDDDLCEVGAFHCYLNSIAAVPPAATKANNITTQMIKHFGLRTRSAVSMFYSMSLAAGEIIAHNFEFDDRVMGHTFDAIGVADKPWRVADKKRVCTMRCATPVCKLPNPRFPGDYKWPRLSECAVKFSLEWEGKAHNALADVRMLIKVYRCLSDLGAIRPFR